MTLGQELYKEINLGSFISSSPNRNDLNTRVILILEMQ